MFVCFTVIGIGICFGFNCGYALNPARDLAPRLFTGGLSYLAGVRVLAVGVVPGECGTWLGVMLLAMGVVPGVMVPDECGTWLRVMVLAILWYLL